MARTRSEIFGSRLAVAIATMIATALVFSGGMAVAFSVPPNSVNSAKIVNGTVRGIDIKNGTVTHHDLAGYLRPRWVKFDADSSGVTYLSGRGVVLVAPQGVGIYRVRFNRSVNGCGWMATRNDNAGGIAQPGEIAVERGLVATDLWVRTFTSAGVLAHPEASDGVTVQLMC